MNRQGKFHSSVLVTMDGLPIAASPSPQSPETTDAMVSLVRGVINRVQHQLRLAKVDEVSLVGGDGRRLVCRYFSSQGEEFILAIIAPSDKSYRRVTSKAIRAMQQILSGKGRAGHSPGR